MDRIYCIQTTIESSLAEHMVYTHNAKYRQAVDDIQSALGILYQVAGEAHFQMLDEEQAKFEVAVIDKYLLEQGIPQ